MPGYMKDKLFVIIGSAGGLGGKVCLSDVNRAGGEETLRELSGSFGGERIAFEACDVTKEESVDNLMDEAEKKLGAPLYCVMNNAGVMGEKEGWRLCMEINLNGVLHAPPLL